MNRPYNNHVHYDPGRLDYKLKFLKQVTNPDGAGGTEIVLLEVLSTWAAKQEIGEYDPVVSQEGLSTIDGSCYFVIRARKGFIPEIDTLIEVGGERYTIRGIKQKGQPVTHWKLLCAYRNNEYDTD